MSSDDSGSSQNYGNGQHGRQPRAHAVCMNAAPGVQQVGATNRGPVAVVSGDVSLLGQPKDALFEDELGVTGTHFGESE